MDDLDAGVGHQDIHLTECLDGLVDAGVHLLLVGHVHGDRDCRLRVPQFAGGCRGDIEVEIGDDDTASSRDVALGDGVADAACGTGDERDLAVDPHDAYSFQLLR